MSLKPSRLRSGTAAMAVPKRAPQGSFLLTLLQLLWEWAVQQVWFTGFSVISCSNSPSWGVTTRHTTWTPETADLSVAYRLVDEDMGKTCSFGPCFHPKLCWKSEYIVSIPCVQENKTVTSYWHKVVIIKMKDAATGKDFDSFLLVSVINDLGLRAQTKKLTVDQYGKFVWPTWTKAQSSQGTLSPHAKFPIDPSHRLALFSYCCDVWQAKPLSRHTTRSHAVKNTLWSKEETDNNMTDKAK